MRCDGQKETSAFSALSSRRFILPPLRIKEFCAINLLQALFAPETKMSDIAVKSATAAASKETWSEDWLSVIIGVLVFALALFSLSGTECWAGR